MVFLVLLRKRNFSLAKARKKENRKAANDKGKLGWRRLSIILLASSCVILLIGFMFAHWAERQLLTTNNWVEMVAPLPKDEQVASSLADYSVNKLLEGIDVEQRVANVLPPAASFVAPAIAERIDSRATSLAKNIIQSDRFQGLWIAANRLAHQQLIDKARSGPDSQGGSQQKFSLNLQELSANIKERLGANSTELLKPAGNSPTASDSKLSIGVELKASFARFQQAVKTIDFLNSVLLLAAIAALIGAFALSRTKRRLAIILSTILATISLLQLIGIQVLRPEVLNQVEQANYRPAAGVIYDGLLASFRRSAEFLFALSLATLALLIVSRTSWISHNKFLAKWRADIKKTAVWSSVLDLRVFIAAYRWPIAGIGTLLVLVFMAFVPSFDWTGLVQAALVISIMAGAVSLAAAPAAKPSVATALGKTKRKLKTR